MHMHVRVAFLTGDVILSQLHAEIGQKCENTFTELHPYTPVVPGSKGCVPPY